MASKFAAASRAVAKASAAVTLTDRSFPPNGAALNTAQVRPGSTVAVIGCGGVGQAVIQGARIAGASRIFAIDPVEMKRTAATAFGATMAVASITIMGLFVNELSAALLAFGGRTAFLLTAVVIMLMLLWGGFRAAAGMKLPRKALIVWLSIIPFGVTTQKLQPIYHMAAFVGQGIPNFEIRKVQKGSNLLVETPKLGKALAAVVANKPAALMRGIRAT